MTHQLRREGQYDKGQIIVLCRNSEEAFLKLTEKWEKESNAHKWMKQSS